VKENDQIEPPDATKTHFIEEDLGKIALIRSLSLRSRCCWRWPDLTKASLDAFSVEDGPVALNSPAFFSSKILLTTTQTEI